MYDGRVRGVWVAIVLAACSSPTGLRIDVPLDHGRAELLLPTQPCGDQCTGIAPQFAAQKLAGPVTFLDSPTRFVAERSDDGEAHFQIDPPTELPVVYVIGFDDSDQPTGIAELDDIHVKKGNAEHYRVLLDAEAFAPSSASGSDLYYVWRQPTSDLTHASCLGIQHADGSAEFFVPSDDPDCDAIVGAAECDPYYYLYSTPPGIGSGLCLNATTPPGVDACEIGRVVQCSDVVGGPGCAALPLHPTCLPRAACDDCGATYSAQCFQTVRQDPSLTYIECKLPAIVGTTGTGSFDAPCTSNNADSTTFTDVDAFFTGGDCTHIGFVDPAALMPGSIVVSQTFALVPANGGGSDASIGVDPPSSKCMFNLHWTGSVTRPGTAPEQLAPGLIVIRSPSGNDLVIPLKVTLVEDGCTTSMICNLMPKMNVDTIWSCAQ